MKFCKDCKWASNESIGAICHSPRVKKKVDRVTGKCESTFANVQRMLPSFLAILEGTCGTRGRFFEPKENSK